MGERVNERVREHLSAICVRERERNRWIERERELYVNN